MLGEGGFAVVYLARMGGHQVAVKVSAAPLPAGRHTGLASLLSLNPEVSFVAPQPVSNGLLGVCCEGAPPAASAPAGGGRSKLRCALR